MRGKAVKAVRSEIFLLAIFPTEKNLGQDVLPMLLMSREERMLACGVKVSPDSVNFGPGVRHSEAPVTVQLLYFGQRSEV